MANYSTTPLAVDAFSRYFVDRFDEKSIISVPTAFQAFFGRPETGAKTVFNPDSAVVDIDIIRGNEKLAALVHRGTNARSLGTNQKNVSVQKFTNTSRVYPLIEEEGDLSAHQLLFRLAGENPYEQKTRLERMRAHAADVNQEIVRRCMRTFEYLCTQSILTGKMPAILGTAETDLIYDFRRKATHIIDLTTPWDDTNADIMGDIDTSCDLIRADAHVNPDMFLLSGDTMDVFLKDDDVKEKADNRRYELIEVSTNNPVPAKFNRFVEAGFTGRGRLRTPKGYELWMFTYTDVYTDAAGDPQKYMPDKTALICYSGARCDRYFGPPDRLPVTAQERAWYQEMFGFSMDMPMVPPNVKDQGNALVTPAFYFDAYPSEDKKTVSCRVQTAPIFATTQTDAFVTLNDTLA